jgi:hypothetical protein
MYTLTSRFIETPTKKIAQVKMDTTSETFDLQGGLSDVDFAGASVRVEIKAWQDDAAQIDRTAIEKELIGKGASEVDIRIIRVPRETVRSAEVTKAQGLPEKVTILAKARGEEVPEGVLSKAADLEMMPAEQILERVGA